MRVMALDVGDKTIGVAISDALLITAQGRPTIRRTRLEKDIEILCNLVRENEVHEIVVGQPLHMDGRQSPQGLKIAKFARKLQQAAKIAVVFWDERLTSVAAEEHLKELGLNWRRRREKVDQVAAMLILQSYLDRKRPSA
jgi:putative Holliday junction resolvase